MVDLSEYKVGEISSVEDLPAKGSKAMRLCIVNVGDDSSPLSVVSSAPNVRQGSRVAVAPVGSTVLTKEGDEIEVKKAVVHGVTSEGMLCDSRMLGWSGGAEGVAVQIPASISVGESPPSSKPRFDKEETTAVAAVSNDDCLFEKKLSKEEKKKLAEEKRKARKAAKEAKAAAKS